MRIVGNQKGGDAKAKKDSKKNHNGTGKPNENNTSTPSQPHGQPDGQPHGQLGGQPYGQPSSNITEQKVISIKQITSARATDELTEWILSKTRLTEKTMPIPMHLVKTWVKNYHIDDIKKAITRVVRQRSYDIDKIKGLSYFAPAINIEYEKRLATLEMVIDAKVRGMDDENWCNLVSMWVEGREWPENYGPAPDEKSNLIPKKITRKYSGAIAARNKPKAVVNGGDEGVDFDSE